MKKAHFLIFTILLFLPAAFPAAAKENKHLEKLHALNKDIILLNLVNGLYLTAEQTESLLNKIEKAESIRDRFVKEMESHTREFAAVLNDLKKVLLAENEIPKDLKHSIYQMKALQHEIEDARGEGLIRLESEIVNMLTENQLIVMETYIPCTIPPARGKIGQSVETAAAGLAHLLTRIRRFSQNDFDNMKPMFIENHLDRIEKHAGNMTPEEKTVMAQKMAEVLENARVLSDQEFMVRKGEMARSLLPPDVKKERRLKKYQLGKAGTFLLDPALIPILKAKYIQ